MFRTDTRGLNRIKELLRDAWLLDVDEVRLEETLGRFESFATNADCPSVGQLKSLDFSPRGTHVQA